MDGPLLGTGSQRERRAPSPPLTLTPPQLPGAPSSVPPTGRKRSCQRRQPNTRPAAPRPPCLHPQQAVPRPAPTPTLPVGGLCWPVLRGDRAGPGSRGPGDVAAVQPPCPQGCSATPASTCPCRSAAARRAAAPGASPSARPSSLSGTQVSGTQAPAGHTPSGGLASTQTSWVTAPSLTPPRIGSPDPLLGVV